MFCIWPIFAVFSYVRKSFSYAFSYSKPDVILFLGDLFDEGSKASGQEYMVTLDRFNSVFEPAKHIKVSLRVVKCIDFTESRHYGKVSMLTW